MRLLTLSLLAACACVACLDDRPDNGDFFERYAGSFDNRRTISVDIRSEVPGAYYALYYGNPYDEEALVRQPALKGLTPIATTLDVPADVGELYVVGEGEARRFEVGDLRIASPSHSALARTRADINRIPAEVMTAVNSIYFPETTNNVRGDDLFKCTDLVIARTPASGPFERAEVWLTFLGDGGCRQSQLYGKLWCYTYPSDKMERLRTSDCTFYGLRDGEVVSIDYEDVREGRDYLFYTREEFPQNVASYKRIKLGEFPKGVNVGFVYIGNSEVGNGGLRFTTPHLNPRVQRFTLNYRDDKKRFYIEDNYLANGYICHVEIGDFEGNILGMENRIVTEGSKYDGDYNDMLCLVESNPRTIRPNDEVETGNSGRDDEDIACKTSTGLYLFEDNYPSPGDFDFNDAVIRYEIRDYWRSSNRAKQVTVEALAVGAGMRNKFGFWNGNKFACLIDGLEGYRNVYPTQTFEPLDEPVTQTLYGDLEPCLQNGSGFYIYRTNFNTADFPCVLDIPLSDPDDEDWHFEWPQETESLDDCYYFLADPSGGERDKDWYRTPRDRSLLFHR